MLKLQMQQKLGLRINPLQIQLIKLLEIPTYQLEQRIKEELEKNPLLEEGTDNDDENDHQASEDAGEPENSEDNFEEDNQDNFSNNDEEDDYSDSEFDDYDGSDYKLSVNNKGQDQEDNFFTLSNSASFRDLLHEQLGLLSLNETDQLIAEYIIGNIDDNGYLRRDIEQIADDIAFSTSEIIQDNHILEILHKIQALDPIGVGARNLQECLSIQIEHKINQQTSPIYVNAKRIIDTCFEEFSKKHYEKIAKKLHLSDEELKEAIDEILRLNPKPAGSDNQSAYTGESANIIPDFTLDLVDDELQLSLMDESIPNLRVNKTYLNLLDSYKAKGTAKEQKEVMSFVKYKLASAKGFIDAIQQRNQTLMLTMTAIIQLQKEFFMTGDESKRRPMILKDVADITGLDVSTVSRVSNSKYVQCWFGMYALKDFFSGSLQNTQGEEISTDKIKNKLKEIVDHENKKQPFTDDELVDLLTQSGYKIARRTIAKYRQMLDIQVARLRREM